LKKYLRDNSVVVVIVDKKYNERFFRCYGRRFNVCDFCSIKYHCFTSNNITKHLSLERIQGGEQRETEETQVSFDCTLEKKEIILNLKKFLFSGGCG
jgi:hypothetical protein